MPRWSWYCHARVGKGTLRKGTSCRRRWTPNPKTGICDDHCRIELPSPAPRTRQLVVGHSQSQSLKQESEESERRTVGLWFCPQSPSALLGWGQGEGRRSCRTVCPCWTGLAGPAGGGGRDLSDFLAWGEGTLPNLALRAFQSPILRNQPSWNGFVKAWQISIWRLLVVAAVVAAVAVTGCSFLASQAVFRNTQTALQ